MRREVWSAGDALLLETVTIATFLMGLALTLASSELFARGLTRLGTKLGFSEGLLGLLAAFGANSPNPASAVIAMVAGAGTVGVGVVVGSNLFNLAAMLGLTGVLAGGIRIRRAPLILDASVGLLVIGAAGLMVAHSISPAEAALFAVPLTGAYVLLLAVPRWRLRRFRPVLRSVPLNLIEIAYEFQHDMPAARHGSWLPVALLPISVAGVIGGSFVMVHEALAARSWLHLSDAMLGTVLLAALTSLPNLWVALHFARAARGTALLSYAMNSNTINLVVGLIVPVVFVNLATTRSSLPYFGWLLDLTLLAVLAPLPHSRLSRVAGGVLVALYLAFAAITAIGLS